LMLPSPQYPRIAQRWGHEGRVLLEITIGSNGRVKNVEVLRSSGFSELDKASVQVVSRRWRFKPSDQEITTKKEFEFKLRP